MSVLLTLFCESEIQIKYSLPYHELTNQYVIQYKWTWLSKSMFHSFVFSCCDVYCCLTSSVCHSLTLQLCVVVLCIVIGAAIFDNEKQYGFKGWGRSRHTLIQEKKRENTQLSNITEREKSEGDCTQKEKYIRLGWLNWTTREISHILYHKLKKIVNS